MELEAKSRGEQAPVKTSLASTQTNGTDLGEHHSSEERQEHKHGHEHGHQHGHHAQNLHATQTDSTEGVQSAKELEEHEARGDGEDDSEDEEAAYCYGNDIRCKESAERECDLLEEEGADCRWLGERSSGSGAGGSGASADERSMAVAIH